MRLNSRLLLKYWTKEILAGKSGFNLKKTFFLRKAKNPVWRGQYNVRPALLTKFSQYNLKQ
jgi:hypothetical protein